MTFEEAKRKARYGHRDYIAVPNGNGVAFEPLTVSSLKRALLAAGTQGRFLVIAANNAVPYRHSWSVGINMIRNAKHIGIAA